MACLIIDVELSGIDGFDLHQRLISRGDRLPTIFISAAIDPAVGLRAASAGARIPAKPFSEASLLGPVWRVASRYTLVPREAVFASSGKLSHLKHTLSRRIARLVRSRDAICLAEVEA